MIGSVVGLIKRVVVISLIMLVLIPKLYFLYLSFPLWEYEEVTTKYETKVDTMEADRGILSSIWLDLQQFYYYGF